MKENDRILNYLKGNRKGKEANRLEREALKDAFLYEALEGLTTFAEDPVRDIEVLNKKIYKKLRPSWWLWYRGWVAVGILLIGAGGVWFCSEFLFPGKFCSNNIMTAKVEIQDTFEASQEVLQDSLSELKQMPEVESEDKGLRRDEAVPMAKKLVLTSVSVPVVPEPVCGFDRFNRYLRDSLRYPEDALQQKLQGKIKLSFVVNKAGRPSHIRVVEWINHSCNQEAIRLLIDGPAWTYTGSADTVYVIVPFRLSGSQHSTSDKK